MDDSSAWTEFWNIARLYLPSPTLVFEFQRDMRGISYHIARDGRREQFLSSDLLVRDRAALEGNPNWEQYGPLFKKHFVVGCGGTWFICIKDVWSPSVDAEFFLHIMDKRNEWGNPETLLDMGSGTGVLGICASLRLPKLRHITFVDIAFSALAATAINLASNQVSVDCSLHSSLPPDSNYDLGLVAPYYFPTETAPPASPRDAILEAGRNTAMLVNSCVNHCKRVIFVFSSITESYFRELADFEFTILQSLLVPFSLGDNVSHNAYVKAAVDNNLLLTKAGSQFPYWHSIYLAETHHD